MNWRRFVQLPNLLDQTTILGCMDMKSEQRPLMNLWQLLGVFSRTKMLECLHTAIRDLEIRYTGLLSQLSVVGLWYTIRTRNP